MTPDTAALHTCSLYCDRPDCIRQQRDEMRERLAELDAARRDAARYAWLRLRLAAEELDNESTARMALNIVGPIGMRPADPDYNGELDTAIDAAMAREAE